jgi:3-Deoxy-D-manno-octulosonic-acid transferase (kdotransferase)
MYLAYSLMLTLGLFILIPHFLFQALVHGKYIAGLRQRLGNVPRVDGKPVIWLHCVSVGETQAARPLAQRLRQQFPQHALVVSTITLTGQKLAHDVFREEHLLLPFRLALVCAPCTQDCQPGSSAHHGDGALAELSARVQNSENSRGARQRSHLAAVLSQVQADQSVSATRAFVFEHRSHAV